jgi:DNA-binding NarL/FixJ family response regulator
MDPRDLIRVMIAEDDEGIRETLASVVRSEPTLQLAGAVENAEEAIRTAARELPDVAIVDVRMPGGGASATRGIKECSPRTVVLAFSAHTDPLTVKEMHRAGVDGYIVKGSPVNAIIASITRAGSGALGESERTAA